MFLLSTIRGMEQNRVVDDMAKEGGRREESMQPQFLLVPPLCAVEALNADREVTIFTRNILVCNNYI